MKFIRLSINIILVVCLFSLASCSKEIDNREYPSTVASGQFLYNGQPVTIMGTASDVDGTNMLQLTQVGPGTWNPGFIKVFAKEDGSYNITTFDGDYFLRITPGKGPWLPNNDTLRFSLGGSTTKTGLNFNVTPYYWISNYSSTYTDSLFTANFTLEKIVPTAVLEKVVVFLGNTAIVDNTSKVAERAFTTLTPGTNAISVNLKTFTATEKNNLSKTGFLYARVGVKTAGVTDLLYSKTVELKK